MELQLDRVTKQYGTKRAVDRLNLSMKVGVYGLLGANGAGKTTLMRLLCDILNPTSGEIRYDGQNIHVMGEEYRSLLGYLPQNFGYYPEFTAEKFMLYMAALKGLNRSFAKNRTEELLRLVGLEKEHRKKIKTFSGGMKRRLGIAQAMLNEPEILILDEPTAGLDPKERVRFRNLISSFSKDKIVLLSTHIVSDVEYIADKIFLMKEGQILKEGTPEEITAQMNGLVWECEVDEKRAAELEYRYTIVNMKKKNGAIELRIVSDTKPDEAAISVDATLEDMYLYYFKEDGNEAIMEF
jgi:ABC-2 type transport system ATP-binding protein